MKLMINVLHSDQSVILSSIRLDILFNKMLSEVQQL